MLKNKLASAKALAKRVERPALYTVATVSTVIVVLQNGGIRQHNEFLREHNLFDAFYNPDKD